MAYTSATQTMYPGMLMPNSVMLPESDHRMPRKLNNVTTFASRLMPSVSVLSTKSRMSSAMR